MRESTAPLDFAPSRRVAQVTLDHVQTMRDMLAADNRGLVYLQYHQLTGSRQALNQAEITTYSGRLGGAAVEANMWAKIKNPELYQLTLDQFSHDIVEGTLDAIEADIRSGGDGILSDAEMLAADRAVWAEKGMGRDFPGNFYGLENRQTWLDGVQDAGTVIQNAKEGFLERNFGLPAEMRPLVSDLPGAFNGAAGMAFGHNLGKREMEFADPARYAWVESEGIFYVVNRETQRVEFARWNESDFNRPVDNAIESVAGSLGISYRPDMRTATDTRALEPGSVLNNERQGIWDFTQANQASGTRFVEGLRPELPSWVQGSSLQHNVEGVVDRVINEPQHLPESQRIEPVEFRVEKSEVVEPGDRLVENQVSAPAMLFLGEENTAALEALAGPEAAPAAEPDDKLWLGENVAEPVAAERPDDTWQLAALPPLESDDDEPRIERGAQVPDAEPRETAENAVTAEPPMRDAEARGDRAEQPEVTAEPPDRATPAAAEPTEPPPMESRVDEPPQTIAAEPAETDRTSLAENAAPALQAEASPVAEPADAPNFEAEKSAPIAPAESVETGMKVPPLEADGVDIGDDVLGAIAGALPGERQKSRGVVLMDQPEFNEVPPDKTETVQPEADTPVDGTDGADGDGDGGDGGE